MKLVRSTCGNLYNFGAVHDGIILRFYNPIEPVNCDKVEY